MHFVFGYEQSSAFQTMKLSLMSAYTLGYFDPRVPTQDIADARPVGLGGVLLQKQEGQSRVISLANRSLTKVERRYYQTEKEAFALAWACDCFHAQLYGTEMSC